MNLELATASSRLQSSSHWSEHLSLDRRPGHVAQGVFVVSGRVAPHIKKIPRFANYIRLIGIRRNKSSFDCVFSYT